MSDKAKPSKTPKVPDLKKPDPSALVAEKLKGGGMRRGGDDDLTDLEVER